jgi:flagellar biosynthesis protein FlhB
MKNQQLHMNTTYNLSTKSFFAYHLISIFVNTISIVLLTLVIASVGLIAQSRGSSATQSITLEVKAIAKISVAGNLTPLNY